MIPKPTINVVLVNILRKALSATCGEQHEVEMDPQ